MSQNDIFGRFANSVTVTDGSWGVLLQAQGLPAGACPDVWNVENPAAIEQVARAYIQAGSEVILTNTFRANRFTLVHFGMEARAGELTRRGVEISRAAAGSDVAVFGSIGPTGKIVMMSEVPAEQIYDAFAEQAKAMEQAGADAVLCETFAELDEIVLAARAVRENTKLPVVMSMTFSAGKDGTTSVMGNTPADLAVAADKIGAAAIGANCGAGPEKFVRLAELFRSASPLPVWIKANAGLPELRAGQTVFPLKPAEFAAYVPALVSAGANFIGGCCGTNPDFIRAIRRFL